MCGNTQLIVIQKACVPHYHILIQLTTGTFSRVNTMKHQRATGKLFYNQGMIDTSIQKSKYQMFSEVLKSRLRGTILKQCTISYPINQR